MGKNTRKDQRTGKMGEAAVVLKLMELGYEAFNLNNEFRNFKNADIMCFNPEANKYIMIQVKASFQKTPNFYTGFDSNRKGEIINKKLEENIICPWVFVHIQEKKNEYVYKYYILTQEEVVNLIKDHNKWYWTEGGTHSKATSDNQQVGLPIGVITGLNMEKNGGKTYPRKIKIEAPENAWGKITNLLN